MPLASGRAPITGGGGDLRDFPPGSPAGLVAGRWSSGRDVPPRGISRRMRIPTILLGVAGLGLSLASCVSLLADPSQLGWQTVALIGLSALGGALAIRVPGLRPLPSSLPIVGAMAVTAGAPAAIIAGYCAGFATALAPLEDADRGLGADSSRFGSGWSMGGILALAAGIAASGFSRINLSALSVVTPSAAAPEEVLKSALALLTALLSCWLVAVALRRQSRLVRSAEQRARTGIALVESIALAIEAKDRTSERHLRRMRIYSAEVGRRLGMTPDDLQSLEYAALLHDIGKLAVPESILSKPSGLSSDEFQVMSTHAKVGAEILETTSMSGSVVEMVRHHHERYNGSGYPDGLIGMEIPLGARILAAVDAFEALLSRRPYRPGVPVPQVVSYLQRHAGDLFDPRVIRILVEHHSEFEDLVVAEEKARAERPASRGTSPPGAETRKITPPLQAVLDRIASSHMEIYSLHEIAQALGKTMNIDESFMLIAAKIHRLIHFSTCAIYIFEPEEEMLRARFATGLAAARIYELMIPLGQYVSGWAALQQRPASGSRGAATEGADAGHSDFESIDSDADIARLASSLSAPLLVDNNLVGVVTLYDDADHDYTHQEEHLLGSIARQVAPAVRTGLLFEQTQEHALTDSLTGLPNSRYMFIAFDQEAVKAREQGTPLTLMVLDIDKFREINDDFGHHAGDRFLVGMAKAIRSQMRVCDTCIRYAGDEFVAILPGLSGQEIEAVVERMTDAAKDYCLEARPGRPVHLSLSIGYATLPGDGEDFETLIALADSRMKQQKAANRGRGADQDSPVPFATLARPRRH